jgi:NADPH2:quinone reductase
MTMTKIKQVQFSAYGSPDVLTVVESEIPVPQAGEIRVKVEAIGVNYSDILRRKNMYFMPTPLPYVPGAEVVGLVDESGSSSLKMGQRVLAILPGGGGYSEYITANEQFCIPLPPHIDAAQATAIFVQGSTAHLILNQLAGDLAGKTVLIHAAAGGVGSLLVQLARHMGATVIGTGSPGKLGTIQQLGAIAAIDYTKQGWHENVIQANQGQKVDLVLEMVGGEVYEKSFSCLKPMGTMIVYGAASGKKGIIHSEHFVNESHSLISFNLAHFIQYRMQDWQASLAAVIGLVAEGKLVIDVSHQFTLSEAAMAHTKIEDRQTTGKVVIIP